ncbi:MAG: carboxylase [Rhizobacter sp.]|nr:carboxylase [Rhizobacter sp.]
MSSIEVVKPGMFSTFQDLGRYGFQSLGVSVSGAMDELSHRLANLLVGNDEAQATLEMTMVGATLRFNGASVIAVCGADLEASLLLEGADAKSATPVDLATATAAPAGSVLQFGKRQTGMRGYLAVAGGFELPLVMGSASTHVRGALGGFEGRALRKGDVIGLREAAMTSEPLDATATELLSQLLGADVGTPIRVSRGREWSLFTAASQAAFLAESMTVTSQSDRMAYRLDGPVLTRTQPGDILSEAVAFGTVQVPPQGLPMVLMADRQSTGGYPRIAQVASVDLPRLAQIAPGESIRFEMIDVMQAQRLLVERARLMQALRESLTEADRDIR